MDISTCSQLPNPENMAQSAQKLGTELTAIIREHRFRETPFRDEFIHEHIVGFESRKLRR